jgi:ABC-type multidrug transport system fused ATPase/permease subunit
MDKELLIYGGIILMAVIIVVSLIKKAVKLVLTIISVLVVLSLINIFVLKVSPIEELNGYKTNIQYSRDIAKYTGNIKESVNKIKEIVESKKYNKASIETIKEENEKLRQYQKEVKELKHTKKLSFFHDKYCQYLNTIVATTDYTAKAAAGSGKTIEGAEEILNKLKTGLDNLSGLKTK